MRPSILRSIREQYHDPDWRVAVMYDSKLNGHVRLQKAQLIAEKYYLACLPRLNNALERCEVYTQLSVLIQHDRDEQPDYPKSRQYARMAIDAASQRLGNMTIRARSRAANGPDMSREELFMERLRFYIWLTSFDEKSAKANWIPVYQVAHESEFQAFMTYVEFVKREVAHQLTSVSSSDKQPHYRLQCVIDSAPGTEAAKIAHERLNTLWGAAVDNVQSMLVVKQAVLPFGKTPELTAQIRNQGKNELEVAQAQQLCEIEVDGRWYRWTGTYRVKSSAFPPKREYKGIPIVLDKHWQNKETDSPLTLDSGRHTIRVAFLPKYRDAERGGPVAIRVVSNPIHLDILLVAWRKADGGIRVGIGLTPRSVGPEQSPSCWWYIQNVSNKPRAVWLGEEDLVSIGRNGKPPVTYGRGFRNVRGVMLTPRRRVLKPGELHITSTWLNLLAGNEESSHPLVSPLSKPGWYQIKAVYDPYDPAVQFRGQKCGVSIPM